MDKILQFIIYIILSLLSMLCFLSFFILGSFSLACMIYCICNFDCVGFVISVITFALSIVLNKVSLYLDPSQFTIENNEI